MNTGFIHPVRFFVVTSLIVLSLLPAVLPAQPASRELAALLIRDPKTNKHIPLKISDLRIDVRAVGNLARTTIEMTFYNDRNRILEGSFIFPLGEGRTVSRFAMNIDGRMREGVVVEKERGRVAFESVVRSQIDPGLLEWTAGNNFRARVYPIPRKGYKKILVAFEQELKDTKEGFLYRLPLAFRYNIDRFTLRAEAIKQEVRPIPRGNAVTIRFKKWHESYLAGLKKKNYRPPAELAFLLPRTPAYRKVVIEKDPLNRKSYFYIHLFPKIKKSKRRAPKSVSILWDASDSARNRKIESELSLLKKYITWAGNLKVTLILFRNDVEKPEDFAIRNGDADALLRRLRNVRYDGGTQLGALDLTRLPGEEFLLFSDGISNFGKRELRTSDKPIIVINSQATANHGYLRYLASKTGGIILNLNRLDEAEATEQLFTNPYYFLRAEIQGGEVAGLEPEIPEQVGSDFSLSGEIKSRRAKILLQFGSGNRVLYTETVELTPEQLSDTGGLLRRIWAQKRAARLEMQPVKHEQELIRLGRNHSIVTRYTSLIVLERLEDYVKFRIKPPADMRSRYNAALAEIRKQKRQEKRDHLEEVIEKYKTLQKWWEHDFPTDKPPVKETAKKEDTATANGRHHMNGDRERRSSPRPPARNGHTPAEEPTVADGQSPTRAKEKTGKKVDAQGGITLKKWDPSTPYLKKLKATPEKEQYAVYLMLKKDYSRSSAFYLDVADFFLERKQKRIALRVLSSIAEMELENHQLLRILGHRLSQLNRNDLAVVVFEEVLKMRREEPQSYRDLALACAAAGERQRAVDLLYQIVNRKWDSRFADIELIALNELNALLAADPKLDRSGIDKRLIRKMPVDIRVVLNWDADNTDMDLWVTDPNEEKCYYSHNLTHIGGRMSRDFTRGYGPEEFMAKRGKKGRYVIQVNYYGSSQQLLAGAVTVQIQLFLNYGRPGQKKKEITVRLKGKKEVVTIGEFDIK